MTLAIITNIILSAIAFTAIIGLITRSIMTSPEAQLTAPAKTKSRPRALLRSPSPGRPPRGPVAGLRARETSPRP
jgi:hypothetical protein